MATSEYEIMIDTNPDRYLLTKLKAPNPFMLRYPWDDLNIAHDFTFDIMAGSAFYKACEVFETFHVSI